MKPAGTTFSAASMLPRTVPFAALALAVCALFALVGLAVLDDYGLSMDEAKQRSIAASNLDYILGDPDALPEGQDRFYGIALEMPLLLIERALGLRDSRDIFLMRHLLTHLFFILGGFFCGLLAWRMFGSRALAVLAMLLFLLHPRLYAHSFFNSKDPTFAAMFMIALFLIHRAFRRETPGAFALCGLGVGLGIGMRPFGLLLLPAVLALRALDAWHAPGGPERRRALASGGAFAASALATAYFAHPYCWANPLRVFEGLGELSQHAAPLYNLFQGEIIPSDEVPPHFIATWFAITAPPLTLLLGIAGAAAVCWRGALRPDRILRNSRLRFEALLLGCATLPIAIAIALQSNIYSGWRHFHFLWAPFSLLAAVALHGLAGNGGRRRQAGRGEAQPPLWTCAVSLRRTLVLGAAGASLASVAGSMAALHPHGQVYFNLLVNRAPPGALAQRYEMAHLLSPHLQGYEYLRKRYPDATLHVGWPQSVVRIRKFLPQPMRRKLVVADEWMADFYIGHNYGLLERNMPSAPVIYERRAYGSAYLRVVAPKLVWGAGPWPEADAYRAAYKALKAAAKPLARSIFDIYLWNGALYYVQEQCGTAAPARFFLHVFPSAPDDLPTYRRPYNFDNLDFSFGWRGGRFDGRCMTQVPLPGYPIARIRTGQFVRGEGQLWKAVVPIGEGMLGQGGGRPGARRNPLSQT